MISRWSKWWWLRVYSIGKWSDDERRALGAFGFMFLSIFLVVVLLSYFFFLKFGFDTRLSWVGSTLVGLFTSVLNTHEVAREIFPDLINRADEAAAKRLGGIVIRPDESPGLWWLDYRYTYRWSREEQWTRNAIFIIAAVLFIPSAFFAAHYLPIWLGLSKRMSILVMMVTLLPLSFYIARQFIRWMWPGFVKAADDNAIARVNHRNPTRMD